MEINVNPREFKQLINDVALIKNFLLTSGTDPEGELTDWAKKELADARKIPDDELIGSKEIENEFL